MNQFAQSGSPVIRVSILRCQPDRFAELRKMMIEANGVLEPGISKMRGLVRYVAGSDEATSSLANVSIWRTLEDAHQIDRFQPMLNLAGTFAAKGATFERPIMNYDTLWEIDPSSGSGIGDTQAGRTPRA